MSYTLIYNGTLIDGSNVTPIQDGAILLKDNKIADVGRKVDIKLPDADITMIDANGGTILPGMIDTHVHMMFRDLSLSTVMTRPFSYQFYDAIQNFEETLMCGVTTVRDAGGADFGIKQALNEGIFRGPRMQISINLIGNVGGHSDDYLLSGARANLFSGYPGRPDGIADGVEGVRRKVREMRQMGAEVIKICTTGGVGSPQDHPFDVTFSPAEVEAIVEEAAFREGTRVMSHAIGAAGINVALRAGVHSIEHATLIDEEGIELALKSGAWLVPTLLVTSPIARQPKPGDPPPPPRPPWVFKKGSELMARMNGQMKRAYEAGVKIAMGTDSGVMPHGFNLHELHLMCDEFGMQPMEAIQATTKVAAECMGDDWAAQVGTLEKGKLADVIICATDPLADIKSLADPANITLVMKDGIVEKDIRK